MMRKQMLKVNNINNQSIPAIYALIESHFFTVVLRVNDIEYYIVSSPDLKEKLGKRIYEPAAPALVEDWMPVEIELINTTTYIETKNIPKNLKFPLAYQNIETEDIVIFFTKDSGIVYKSKNKHIGQFLNELIPCTVINIWKPVNIKIPIPSVFFNKQNKLDLVFERRTRWVYYKGEKTTNMLNDIALKINNERKFLSN